jgi:hypothetical protein
VDWNQDIRNWKAEVERLELNGHTVKDNAVHRAPEIGIW